MDQKRPSTNFRKKQKFLQLCYFIGLFSIPRSISFRKTLRGLRGGEKEATLLLKEAHTTLSNLAIFATPLVDGNISTISVRLLAFNQR